VLATDGVGYLKLKTVRLYTAAGDMLEMMVNEDVLEHPES
jgi:hypothetical protein